MTNLTQIIESLESRHFFWNFKRQLIHKPVKQLTRLFIRSQLAYTRWFLEEIRYDFFTDSEREILLTESYRSLLWAKVVIHQFGRMLQELDELGYMSCVAKGLKENAHFLKGKFEGKMSLERKNDLLNKLSSSVEVELSAIDHDGLLTSKTIGQMLLHFFAAFLTIRLLAFICPVVGTQTCIVYLTVTSILHFLVFSRMYTELHDQLPKPPKALY